MGMKGAVARNKSMKAAINMMVIRFFPCILKVYIL